MKLELNIDASSLSSSACVLNWHRTIVLGYREKVPGASLVYGTAVHKFIDTMLKTSGDLKAAREAAFLSFRRDKISGKTNQHLTDERHLFVTCFDFWERFILKDTSFQLLVLPNGTPASEVTFSLPYYETEDCIVRLCGTIDGIGKIHNGVYCIRDFKTTSRYNVDEYLADYKMSKQLRFYVLALRLMARREPESLLGKIGATQVGARIDGIFLKSKPSDNIYKSSQVFQFSDETMDEFEAVLKDQIARLALAIRNNHFPREGIVNGTCKGEYRCKFYSVCGAPKEVQQLMLERDYRSVPYEPLKFGEV